METAQSCIAEKNHRKVNNRQLRDPEQFPLTTVVWACNTTVV